MLKRTALCLTLISLALLQVATNCFAQEGGKKIRVLVWDEQQPSQKSSYKNFLGNHIAEHLKGFKDFEVKSVALDDPEAAIEYVRERDGLIDVKMETRRLKLALESVVDTPDAREYGVGGVDDERLRDAVALVAKAYDLPTLPSPSQVFDSRFLPPVDERMLLPEAE